MTKQVPARAYYNEINPEAADILRALIEDDVIAPGDVDERSIKKVEADDLIGYTQCHFFAGGGLWSVAARLAGWPDERPLYTGSCPCQPFSVAGRQGGADDPRHLWPDFHRLIRARRPAIVMGEQVAGKAGINWFNGVRSDLASEGYAGRAVDIPACAVDAPHRRQRLYWVAVADGAGTGRSNAEDARSDTGDPRSLSGRGKGQSGLCEPERIHGANGSWWADAERVECFDGKTRRTQPGTRFLVDGFPGRVGLWRIAGNAISPILAAEVIGAFLDVDHFST